MPSIKESNFEQTPLPISCLLEDYVLISLQLQRNALIKYYHVTKVNSEGPFHKQARKPGKNKLDKFS